MSFDRIDQDTNADHEPKALAIAPRRRVASTKEIEAALAKQTAEADRWREACNEARLAAGELEAEL